MTVAKPINQLFRVLFWGLGLLLIAIGLFFKVGFNALFEGAAEKSLVNFGFFQGLFILLGICFIAFPFLLTLLTKKLKNKQDKAQSYLVEKGLKGKAALISIVRTGVFVNQVPQFLLELEIKIDKAKSYPLSCKKFVGFQYLHLLKEGMEVTVFVNPDHPQHIFLNWEETGISPAFETDEIPQAADSPDFPPKYKPS